MNNGNAGLLRLHLVGLRSVVAVEGISNSGLEMDRCAGAGLREGRGFVDVGGASHMVAGDRNDAPGDIIFTRRV